MCLRSLTKPFKHNNIGYKVFFRKKLTTQYVCGMPVSKFSLKSFIGAYFRKRYGSNIWYEDKAGTIKAPGGFQYRKGFHIFPRKSDAIKYAGELGQAKAIVKVEFGGDIVYGKHTNREGNKLVPCVVATKMKLLEVVKCAS